MKFASRHPRIVGGITAALLAGSGIAMAQQPELGFRDPAVFCTIGSGTLPNGCTQSTSNGLAIADVTSATPGVLDDYPEVAVCNNLGDGSVSVFRNTGSWSNAQNGLVLDLDPSNGLNGGVFPLIAALGVPYDVEWADMDIPADGYLDLVVSVQRNNNPDAIVILFNDGEADFSVRSQQAIILNSARSAGILVLDADRDGDNDIAVAAATGNESQSTLPQTEIVRALGSGTYASDVYPVPNVTESIMGTDITAGYFVAACDTCRIDLAMSMTAPDNQVRGGYISVLRPDGATSYTVTGQPAVGSTSIIFGKLGTGVGKDIVLDDFDFSEARLMKGNYTGNFTPLSDLYPITTLNPFVQAFEPRGMDLNGLDYDTRNDVAIACGLGGPCSYGCIAVFQGRAPTGPFGSTPRLWPTPRFFQVEPCAQTPARKPFPRFVKIANMNQLGFNDLVVANSSGSISVLINENVAPPPG